MFIWFIIGFICGGFFGLFLAALFVAMEDDNDAE